MVVVLVSVLVGGFAGTSRSSGDAMAQADLHLTTNTPSQRSGEDSATATQPTSREAQRQHLAGLEWDRDPFTRSAAGDQASELDLSGILWDPSQPMAIINGEMVQVGDELDDYRVLEIGPDHVSLTDGTEAFKLEISP